MVGVLPVCVLLSPQVPGEHRAPTTWAGGFLPFPSRVSSTQVCLPEADSAIFYPSLVSAGLSSQEKVLMALNMGHF